MSSKSVSAIVAVFVLMLAGATYYMVNIYSERNRFTPQKIFEQAFDENIVQAENLTGVKDDTAQYDVRLHFKFPHEPKPKLPAEFTEPWVMEARNWFNERYPDEKALQEMEFLKFKSRQKNDATMVTNEWILYNKHTDDVYYRIFGTSR